MKRGATNLCKLMFSSLPPHLPHGSPMFRRFLLFVLAFLFLASPVVAQDIALDDKVANLNLPETDEGLAGDGPIRRYDWFKNLWKNRRATFAADSKNKNGAVVFLGDSITQGWNDDFRGDFGDMVVANRGISGDTTRGMLIRLQEDVLVMDPSAVVMLMGTNDLEEKAEPQTIADNVELIIAALKKHNPDMPIVLCKVFPSSETKKRPAEKIKKINKLYEAKVKGDAQITVVDTWTLFADEKGDAKKSEFPDLLHPNKKGYAKWKSAIVPVLETLGVKKPEPDDFKIESGFESLFNGKDLTGWGFVATSEKQKARLKKRGRPIVEQDVAFDGKTVSTNGRYLAKNRRLIVTTPPEGRKLQQLYTTKQYSGDFKLILEFRATPNADSGVFICGPQLQCRDYALAGPYKTLKKYKPQDWNELVVEVENGIGYCTCNGEVIEEAFKVGTSGPIGLEGDRGQIEYRRLRIKTAK